MVNKTTVKQLNDLYTLHRDVLEAMRDSGDVVQVAKYNSVVGAFAWYKKVLIVSINGRVNFGRN